ncbi:helix-turn-helix transcriptional regulator, partial [Streptomyces sparsogenes]
PPGNEDHDGPGGSGGPGSRDGDDGPGGPGSPAGPISHDAPGAPGSPGSPGSPGGLEGSGVLEGSGAGVPRIAPGRRARDLYARAEAVDDGLALPLLREAASGFADRRMALWEGHTRLLLAQRLARAGELSAAAEEAGRAKALAVATGSGRLRRLAIDQQRAIGGRRPRVGAATTPALSVRESEIVRMVRLGMPNRDIADTLVISVKTVEAHLTRIFRKTGVRSRTALAAAAAGGTAPG